MTSQPKIDLADLGKFFSQKIKNIRCAWYVAREIQAEWGTFVHAGDGNRGSRMAKQHLKQNDGKPSLEAETWIAFARQNREQIETIILTEKIFSKII